MRTSIQWPARSLWSWPDSHTNPLKIAKNEISQNQKSARTERSLLTSSSRMWRNLLRIPIQWSTRSLWSWSDSHTNPLKITKNEIWRNQKSPQIERYFLRPWLWIRRDFSKIPIQRPKLSVSREGGAILYTKNCKKDVSFYRKIPKNTLLSPKKGKETRLLLKKKKDKETFLYPKKGKNDVPFNKKMQKRVFLWPKNAKKMFLFTKKCQKDAPFSKIGERDASFTKKA